MATSQTGISLQSLKLCQETDVYRAEFDTETTTPSLAIVTAFTEALEVEPKELDQLYHSIDPDAINELLGNEDVSGSVVEITFEFEGRTVAVTSDGSVKFAR